MIRASLVSLLSLFTLAACSPGKIFGPEASSPSSFMTDENQQRIISDRPLNRENVIATIKLSAPSLLESAQIEKGKMVISDEAKALVEKDQREFIAKLKAIAPAAEIIYRYKMILNGVAISAPYSAMVQIESLGQVRKFEPSRIIGRPEILRGPVSSVPEDIEKNNSVGFIEAELVHKNLTVTNDKGVAIAVRGQNIRVGVIDTGIDYTHKMLGGSGNAADYKATNPSQPSAAFPNQKVVGGIDLVGTKFNAASELWVNQVPQPDANPIDEAGHGTHVAGTIGGIGDNVNTYSGVAPDASLYAIKVFGANGSTNDFVVIAGLEFAADPNGDGDPADRLDVVNLSLGGAFGQPQILYSEAVRNLTLGGTVVVASAGNSGPIDYIVGAPSTADNALSVAASIDDMPHNWTYDAVRFVTPSNSDLLARGAEGPISKPIKEIGDVQGELVYIGVGDQNLSDDLKAKLTGKVAFIDRGKVAFIQKLTLAEKAGAIGAVVANHQPGEPFQMGGEGSVKIPAVMVSKDLGDLLKKEMKTGAVSVQFKTGKKIEDPLKIDTITDFSSKGPRSVDSLLKPEITAPGFNIISAMMGEGDKGVQYSGTSMSGPHMAGVMALLRQYHPDLSVEELKALVMTSAKIIHDPLGVDYPLSVQGAGRVRAYKAAISPVLVKTSSLSLGNLAIGQKKMLRRSVELKNLTTEAIALELTGSSNAQMQIAVPKSVSLNPGEVKTITASIVLVAPKEQSAMNELDGFIRISAPGSETLAQIPVMAITTQMSDIVADSLTVHAATASDSSGAAADLALSNRGAQPGLAYAFNLIGQDAKKPAGGITETYKSHDCDLQSAGYRLVKKVVDGEDQMMFQVAVKIREPLTTWVYCEVSVQIDSDKDQLADQELVGIARSNLAGLAGLEFSSLLLDAGKARAIRAQYEANLAAGKEAPISYVPAIIDLQPMVVFEHSTLAIVEMPLKLLKLRPGGELAVKIATLSSNEDAIEPDDFLGRQLSEWRKIDPRADQSGFHGMEESIALAPGETKIVPLTHGVGSERLVVYMPFNRATGSVLSDPQTALPKANYSLAASGMFKRK